MAFIGARPPVRSLAGSGSVSRRVDCNRSSASTAWSMRDGRPAFISQIEMIGTNFANSV